MFQPTVVLVGDRDVGKSTLIAKCHEVNPTASGAGYFTKDFELPSRPTSIKCYPTSVYLSRSSSDSTSGFFLSVFRTNIIDTGGAKRYDNIRPLAYKNADMFIVCFDVTNYTSFQNVSKWVDEVRKYERKTSMILVGTKADLDNKRTVGKNEAKDFARLSSAFRGAYLETSYLDRNTVEAVFSTAVSTAFFGQAAKCSNSKKKRCKQIQADIDDITNLEPASCPPDYPKTLSTISMDWQTTYHSNIATDVIIKCLDDPMNVILTHRFVLCLASKAFKELLCSPTNLTNMSQSKCISGDIGVQESAFPFIESIQCTECNKDKCTALQSHKLCIVLSRTFKRQTILYLLNWMYTGSWNDTRRDDLDFKVDVFKAAKLLEIQNICRPTIQPKKQHFLESTNGLTVTAPQQHDHTQVPLPPLLSPILASSRQHNQSVPVPPPLPPILASARQHNQAVPVPPPLPPILASARQHNQAVPVPPPLPPILASARQHNQAVPVPPPLPPILVSARQHNQAVPVPPPLPPILVSARQHNQAVPDPPPLPPLPASARPHVVPNHHLNSRPLPQVFRHSARIHGRAIPIPPPLPQILASSRRQVPSPPPLPLILPSSSTPQNPNFQSTSPPCFLQLYQDMWREGLSLSNELPTDLVLIVEETPVPVHRAVLVARSPVMASMLEGKFREKHLEQIKLHGVSLEHFRTVLEYLYTDNCSLDYTNANDIMELADRFIITSLFHRCEECIINILENTDEQSIAKLVVEAYYHSKVYYARNLNEWCLHFMATNYNFFENDDDFNVIWRENKVYMENNKWPPKGHMDTLREYKLKAALSRTFRPQNNRKTVKCGCSIM